MTKKELASLLDEIGGRVMDIIDSVDEINKNSGLLLDEARTLLSKFDDIDLEGLILE